MVKVVNEDKLKRKHVGLESNVIKDDFKPEQSQEILIKLQDNGRYETCPYSITDYSN